MPGDQIWPIVLLGISLLGNLILLFQKPIRRLLRRIVVDRNTSAARRIESAIT